jgi:hypothetical protein
MRTLLAIVVLAALGWSGWWYFHATSRDNGLQNWLAGRRDAGWVAEAADISVTGYPNRLDTIVTGLDLADPHSGWSWQASEFQVLSLSYKPNHIIAVWPGPQIIASPWETVRIDSELARGSVVFDPDTKLGLNRTSIEIENMKLMGNDGWQARIASAEFATRKSGQEAPPFSHDLAFSASDITVPEAWTRVMDQDGVLPGVISAANIAATLAFDRAWDRIAVETGNPIIEQIRIRNASVEWGKVNLTGRGTLRVDDQGFAEGKIDLRAENWRDLVVLAEDAGVIGSSIAGAVRAGLELLATFSGGGDALKVPLEFEGGQTRLGPIAIGPAPLLVRYY